MVIIRTRYKYLKKIKPNIGGILLDEKMRRKTPGPPDIPPPHLLHPSTSLHTPPPYTPLPFSPPPTHPYPSLHTPPLLHPSPLYSIEYTPLPFNTPPLPTSLSHPYSVPLLPPFPSYTPPSWDWLPFVSSWEPIQGRGSTNWPPALDCDGSEWVVKGRNGLWWVLNGMWLGWNILGWVEIG